MPASRFSIIGFDRLRADACEWARFAVTIALAVVLPLGLVVALIETEAWRLGETVPLRIVAQRQDAASSLLWRSRIPDDRVVQLKNDLVTLLSPDVLVLGTSRSAQFRSAMFHPYSFYNAGFTGWTFPALTQIVEHLPRNYRPKVVIFSLDFFMFHKGWSQRWAAAAPVFSASDRGRSHLEALQHTLHALLASPRLLWAPAIDPRYGGPALGLVAITTADGYRKDGSFQYSDTFLSKAGKNAHLMRGVTLGMTPLFFGDRMDPGEMAAFETFVSAVRARGALPVGVAVPLYTPLVHAVEDDPRYGIYQDFNKHVADGYFSKLGVVFANDLLLPPYSGDYRYFIDVGHPSEPAVLAAVKQFTAIPAVADRLPDLDRAGMDEMLARDRHASQHIDLYYNEY